MLKTLLISSVAALGLVGAAQAASVPSDVAFDGYCDGMHFQNEPGGFITGYSTGCLSDPLHGVKARVKKQGIANVVTAYGSTTPLTFIVRLDGTFYIESADGSGTVINTGTWTAGTPLVSQGGQSAGLR
jgi:ABC-type phosphate transport system substrate-binding protein